MKILLIIIAVSGIASCTDPPYQKTRRDKLKQTIDSTHAANTGETGMNILHAARPIKLQE